MHHTHMHNVKPNPNGKQNLESEFIETNYHQNAWAEKAFQMIMGFLNVFLFFNMKDGSSKDVIIIYYSLNFLEGTITIIISTIFNFDFS